MLNRLTSKIGIRMEDDLWEYEQQKSKDFDVFRNRNIERLTSELFASLNNIKTRRSLKIRDGSLTLLGQGHDLHFGEANRMIHALRDSSSALNSNLHEETISSFGNEEGNG